MAILNKSQLKQESNITYVNNTAGQITPEAVRAFNDDLIDSVIVADQTGSLNVASSSFATTANTASSTPNAIVTASVNISTITFNKGDGTSFSLTVAAAATASYADQAATSSFALTASFVSGSNVKGTVSSSFTASIANNAITASYAQTASVILGTVTSASFAISSSVAQNAYTASYVVTALTASFVQNALSSSRAVSASRADSAATAVTASNANTASYVVTALTASYVVTALTASYVQNAQSSSRAVSASRADSAVTAVTSSYVLNAVSSSYAANADLLDGKDSTIFATTGSNIFNGQQTVNGNLIVSGNLYVSGSEVVISSSILVVGDRIIELNANRTIGDAGIYVYDVVAPEGTGSLLWNATGNYWMGGFVGSEVKFVRDSDTGSMSVLSSSFAVSSSRSVTASLANTASYVVNALTASYVQNAQTASYIVNALTASFVANAISASRATSALNADTASYVVNALTASFVQNAVSASFATTASYVLGQSATASFALTASYTPNAITSAQLDLMSQAKINFTKGDGTTNSVTINNVSNASNATNAINAETASFVQNALSASFATTASFVIGGATVTSASYAVSGANAYVQNTSANATHYVTFVDGTNKYSQLQGDNDLTYNPNTNLLTATATAAISASFATTATTAQTASFVQNAQTASFVLNAVSASRAVSAASATTASYVNTAETASFVANAVSASRATSALSASYALTASFALNGGGSVNTASLATTGSNIFNGSQTVTGSIKGNVTAITISSNTASINFTSGSYFTLNLTPAQNTYLDLQGITPGITAQLLLATTASATVSWSSSLYQASGAAYIPTTSSSFDLLDFYAFDTSRIFMVPNKNFANVSIPSFVGLLDTYPSAAYAYSVRKLRSAYTGSALRVRRSSDNTEQNIGFDSSGNLDTSALTTFVGASNGFVTTWYDQSGNSIDVTQSTSANQPQIVSSGTVITINSISSLAFDGTDWFVGTLPSTTNSYLSAFTVDKAANNSSNYFIFSQNNGSSLGYSLINAPDSRVIGLMLGDGQEAIFNPNTTDLKVAAGIRRTGTSPNNAVYFNGTIGATTTATNNNTLGTVVNIGTIYSGTYTTSGNISEVIVWRDDKTSNVTPITNNMKTYFGIA
jgi:hypothetical protein